MLRLSITAILSLFLISGFAQKQNKASKKMAEAFEMSLADSVLKFNTKPFYVLEVDNQGCRVLVSINDLPEWNGFFEDVGETTYSSINDLILQSGKQQFTIGVYPLSTEKTLSNKAHANVKIEYAPDREYFMSDNVLLQEYNMPEVSGSQQLEKYEIQGTFDAQVPYNFSSVLRKAKDLSKIPDIENKVLKKYEQLRGFVAAGDIYSFVKQLESHYKIYWSSSYYGKDEIETYPESQNKAFDLSLNGREVGKIENYEIVFYQNNRLAFLRDKNDKSNCIKVYYTDEDGKKGHISPSSVALYMPEGSDEFATW